MALRCCCFCLEYPRAPESKPHAPCWLILDGCACTSYSVFKEPTAQARSHPAWQAPNSRPLAVFGGTFLHYYSHFLAVNQRSTSLPWAPAARAEATSQGPETADADPDVEEPSVVCPAWEPGKSPGAWGLTNRKSNPIYAPREGVSTHRGRRCSRVISPPSPPAPHPGALPT